MKCPRGAVKHRVAKPHGAHSHGSSKSNFKNGIRGHTWEGHGPERRCKNCGAKPRHMRYIKEYDDDMKNKKLGTTDFNEHRNPSDLEEYAQIQEEMRRLRLKK